MGAGLADVGPAPRADASGARHRRLDIQGLRAIAVLMVVAYHAGLPVPGGFVGVDVFFVISGFVITHMLLREWSTHGRIRLGRFYVRRFKRLTPALALVIAVTMVASALLLSPLGTQQDASRTGIGAMLLGANLVIAKITGDYFDLEAGSNPLLNTWSLSVEEQFYLVFPLLLLISLAFLGRSRTSFRMPATAVGAVCAVSLGLALLGASGYVLPREGWLLGFYSPVTRAWEFAAGALIALVGPSVLGARSSRLQGGIGLLLLGVSLFVISEDVAFPSLITLVPVVGTALVIIAGTRESNPVSHLLSAGWLVRIGDWSYSIYLWHWPVIVFATLLWPQAPWVALVAAVLSLGPAVASYRFVETPLRAMSLPRRRNLAVMVAATVLPPLAVSTALWQGAERGFGQPEVQAFQRDVFAQPDGCARVTGLSADTVEECTWNATASGPPVYLLGDSNAGQFLDAVVAATARLDRPATVVTTNACPFLDVSLDRLERPDSWDRYCSSYTQDSLNYLKAGEPGLVIVSNIDTYWDDPKVAVGLPGQEPSTDPATKLEALRAGLGSTVAQLKQAGHAVLVVQTIPRWSGEDVWRTATCTAGRIAEDGCVQTMPVSRALSRQGAVRDVITSVAESTTASVFDPWPILCPEQACTTQADTFPKYYRDGIHVSVPQGRLFTPHFIKVVRGPGSKSGVKPPPNSETR